MPPQGFDDRRSVRVSVDAEAEGVPRRTGVESQEVVAIRVVRRPPWRLQLPTSERQRELVRFLEVIDVEVQVHLLLRPAGQSGGTWLSAACTPMTHSPSTTTLCQRSSGCTSPPSRPAQKRLSAAMLLASNTTTRRFTFMLRLLARRRCTVLQPLEEVEHCGAPAAGDGPDGRATCGR